VIDERSTGIEIERKTRGSPMASIEDPLYPSDGSDGTRTRDLRRDRPAF
jgi:hypothetical protein